MSVLVGQTVAVACTLTLVLVLVLRSSPRLRAAACVLCLVILTVTLTVGVSQALSSVRTLLPTVLFLAASMVLADLCAREGMFVFLGDLLARGGSATAYGMLLVVVAVSVATTTMLGLDATVLMLTPVVFHAAAARNRPVDPYLHATVHMANSGSLLLPVSNLTNLLAFGLSGVSFAGYVGMAAFPWAVGVVAETLALALVFRRDLATGVRAGDGCGAQRGGAGVGRLVSGMEGTETPFAGGDVHRGDVPVAASAVLGSTLVGFFLASPFGIGPWIVAMAGAVALALVRALRPDASGMSSDSAESRPAARRAVWLGSVWLGSSWRRTGGEVLHALDLPFLLVVLSLAVSVAALRQTGAVGWLGELLPTGRSLPDLLLASVIAALLANLINNIPAAMILLPLAAPSGPVLVMAVLLGVNIGPNLTYAGSLANLLWRQVYERLHGGRATLLGFTRIGLVTVPVCLGASVLALWAETLVL